MAPSFREAPFPREASSPSDIGTLSMPTTATAPLVSKATVVPTTPRQTNLANSHAFIGLQLARLSSRTSPVVGVAICWAIRAAELGKICRPAANGLAIS
jgi:hypothetical protein